MRDFLTQAFRELVADRFRTLLSLLGIATGIFSIVAALTLVDSLQETLHKSFAEYGNDILYIEREPLEPDLNEDGVFRWWDYVSRPSVSWPEYRFMKEHGSYKQIAYAAYGRKVVGVAGDWRLLVQQPLASGRGFSADELASGAPVVVVGAEAEARCGEKIWLDGARFEVIGVFEKAGMTAVSPIDIDQVRLVPFGAQKGPILRSSILLAGADPQQVRLQMRTCRRLQPYQKDNFSINRIAFLLDELNDLFRMASRLGWLIGIFSLLAGGIGMANMLYVSVEERRSQIGICRALGARRATIARQFLGEALALAFCGAVAGIGFVALLTALLRLVPGLDLSLSLSFRALFSGLGIALAVGLLFGVAPARSAARLSPVEAMGL